MRRTVAIPLAIAALVASAAPAPRAQTFDQRRKTYDETLDTYVRDGLVYYRALKAERVRFDAYVASLASVDADKLPRDEQIAFWLNAYNAIVLATVIDHYPIQKHSAQYPQPSIRQIPGAFERLTHHVGGKTLTLDQIEQTVLSGYHDPRLFFAIARGSVGGGRLRSEAFAPARLEAQLTDVQNECSSRPGCVQVDRSANTVLASPIFSWREKDFVNAYAAAPARTFAERSPIERAILAYVEPKLLTTEREFLSSNEFKVSFKQFDWTLNDLTGRGGR